MIETSPDNHHNVKQLLILMFMFLNVITLKSYQMVMTGLYAGDAPMPYIL